MTQANTNSFLYNILGNNVKLLFLEHFLIN